MKKNNILFSLNHGWMYSSNSKSLKIKSYWNKKINLGVCADWFVGPRLESGWISANDLFDKICKWYILGLVSTKNHRKTSQKLSTSMVTLLH